MEIVRDVACYVIQRMFQLSQMCQPAPCSFSSRSNTSSHWCQDHFLTITNNTNVS